MLDVNLALTVFALLVGVGGLCFAVWAARDASRQAERLRTQSELLNDQVKAHRAHSDRLEEIIETLASSMEEAGLIQLKRDAQGRIIGIRRATLTAQARGASTSLGASVVPPSPPEVS